MTARIGFIGLGNMGAAIVRGLKDQDVEIHGTDLNKAFVEQLAGECGLVSHDSIGDMVKVCDYVVLAVKPQHAPHVLSEAAKSLSAVQCLISIAAGITLEKLGKMISGKCPVVRVMPNTPALVNAGVFAVCLDDEKLTDEQKSFIPEAFKPLGQVHQLPENMFDAFTAVIGSGPAYVFYFMEAMIESAVHLGIARPMATDMVNALFDGSTKLAIDSEHHISQLREMVTSPAGTTIRALIHMDRTSVRSNIIDAVEESYQRSIELGSK